MSRTGHTRVDVVAFADSALVDAIEGLNVTKMSAFGDAAGTTSGRLNSRAVLDSIADDRAGSSRAELLRDATDRVEQQQKSRKVAALRDAQRDAATAMPFKATAAVPALRGPTLGECCFWRSGCTFQCGMCCAIVDLAALVACLASRYGSRPAIASHLRRQTKRKVASCTHSVGRQRSQVHCGRVDARPR